MASFDSTALPYLGTPLSFATSVTNPDYLTSTTMPTLGLPEHSYQQQTSIYSANNYAPSTSDISSLPLAAPSESERSYASGYDDFPLEPVARDAPEAQEQPAPNSNTSVDRDDKLLSFDSPTYNFTLLDYTFQHRSVSLNARLHGMFFMADPPSTPIFYPQATPPELTCYRRNLFQVTGSITIPRGLRYILANDGSRIPIVAYELCVSATESVEGNTVKLISVPWKTPANNAPPAPEDKSEKEPAAIPLDISNPDIEGDYLTFPIAWKRLQFRIATANNGRRKELQQHFIARLKLVATLPNGNKTPIAEAKSAAIVVRGRSPRNFQQRKDLAIGEKSSIRRGPNSPAMPTRRATTDANPTRSPLKRERACEYPSAAFSFNVQDAHAQGSNPFSSVWSRAAHGSSSAPILATPTFRTPTLPSSKSTSSASPPSVPQPLTRTDETNSGGSSSQRPIKHPRKNSSNSRPHPYKPSLPSPRTLLSGTQSQIQSIKPEDTEPADSSYEYFPVTTDQWQQPVEAVYRPHIIPQVPATAGSMAASMPGMHSRSRDFFGDNLT